MTGKDTEFSGKERKAVEHLMDVLSKKFEISAERVNAYMDRDVVGMQGGEAVERDYLGFSVTMSAVSRNAERLYSIPVQHVLADELSKIWKSQNRPLVYIDIQYETAEPEAGQDLEL